MIFADNPHDREIEKMMQKTPHFHPRGHGIFVSEKTEYNAERRGCKECADRKKKRNLLLTNSSTSGRLYMSTNIRRRDLL